MTPRPVDLCRVAREVVELTAAIAHDRGVAVVLRLAEEPVSASGERGELERVVANLLSNAVKYTPAGGRVEVRVGPHEGERVLLEVTDSGVGIDPVHQERLFDAFYRVRDPSPGPVPGSGLGLAIVQQIVHRHGGRVEVDSVPGVGSTFRVLLPSC